MLFQQLLGVVLLEVVPGDELRLHPGEPPPDGRLEREHRQFRLMCSLGLGFQEHPIHDPLPIHPRKDTPIHLGLHVVGQNGQTLLDIDHEHHLLIQALQYQPTHTILPQRLFGRILITHFNFQKLRIDIFEDTVQGDRSENALLELALAVGVGGE